MKRIVIKFDREKMLMTVDLNSLLHQIFKAFGCEVCIEFLCMSLEEQKLNERNLDVVVGIADRFWVFEQDESGVMHRRTDIEKEVERWGRK